MAKREENEKVKQYKKYRNSQYALVAASWVSMLIPDGILLGVNWNEWVKTGNDAVKVSVGLILTVLISLFVVYKKAKNEFSFNKLTIVIGFWAFVGLIYLLTSLLTEMLYIAACSALGLTISVFLDIPEEYYKAKKSELAIELGLNKGKASEILNATKKAFGVKTEKDKEEKGGKAVE
jgi:hypothetical protein